MPDDAPLPDRAKSNGSRARNRLPRKLPLYGGKLAVTKRAEV